MSEILPKLISATGLSQLDLRLIISNAPSRYKQFPIRKRNGGERIIAQPSRELKALQRALVNSLLSELPVHESAMAYRTGKSILTNASKHAGQGPILKYDFSNFFHSIRADDWEKYCNKNGVFRHEEDLLISKLILFQRDKGSRILKLSIGAPSSPLISNVIMYDFDCQIANAVASDHVVYTRYADDITFSAPRIGHLSGVDRALGHVIRQAEWPRLKLNRDKTVLATKKYRREVTGLMLTNDGQVSLGRDRKRAIRAALHHAKLGKLPPKELSLLSGMLAFAHAVEPEFLARMSSHYGANLIEFVKRFASVSRRAQGEQEVDAQRDAQLR